MAVFNGSDTVADSLTGGLDDDVLNGLALNDTLSGGEGGIDTMYGGANDDLIYTRTDDLAYGGSGNDILSVAGDAPAVLDGGANYDIVRFETAYDISNALLTGVEEFDINGAALMTTAQLNSVSLVSGYNSSTTSAQIILTQGGTADVVLSATLTNYFYLSGSSQADVITFDPSYTHTLYAYMGRGDDNVVTAAGDDSIRGDEGNDTLSGLGGNDSIDGGTGTNKLYGGDGNDTLFIHAGDTASGGTGDDLLSINDNGPAALAGGGNTDTIRFEGSYDISDSVITSVEQVFLNGNDAMTAAQLGSFAVVAGYNSTSTSASVTLTVGGTATVNLSNTLSASFSLQGSADADLLTFAPGYIGAITAYGGYGDDKLVTAAGNDSIRGDDGNDTLSGLAGNDSLDGGSGSDSMSGGDGNDYLIARIGDSLYGGANDDLVSVQESLPAVLSGGSGADTLRFENGFDISRAVVSDFEQVNLYGNVAMTAAQLESFGTVSGYDTNYTTASLVLTQGGTASVNVAASVSQSLSITGSNQADILSFNSGYTGSLIIGGGYGNDSLTGASGNDSFIGGQGNDTLLGVIGNDTLDGGVGLDSLDGGSGNDVLIGRTNDSLYGGNNDDLLSVAENGVAVFNGGTGNDTMRFENSFDISDANLSSMDFLNCYGLDSMTTAQLGSFKGVAGYNAGYTSATVLLTEGGTANINLLGTLSVGFGLTGSADADLLTFNRNYLGAISVSAGNGNDAITAGSGNDYIRGDQGNDTLVGLLGNDTLEGGSGADVLTGGVGIDQLTGGSGRDTFVFDLTNVSDKATPDRITDFEAPGAGKGDLIDVSPIDADGTFGNHDNFTFGSTGINGLSLVDDAVTGNTVVRLNIDSDPAFEIVFVIQDGATLANAYTSADFIL